MQSDPNSNPPQFTQGNILNDKHVKAGNQNQQHNKNKSNSKRLVLDVNELNAFLDRLSLQAKPEIGKDHQERAFVKQVIVPLNNKHIEIYSQSIKGLFQKLKIQHHQESLSFFKQTTKCFSRLIEIYKEAGVNSPILIATYKEFQSVWKAIIKNDAGAIQKQLMDLWRQIPYQQLLTFLKTFSLLKLYQSIKPEEIFKLLSNDLFEGRIQQATHLYYAYIYERHNQCLQNDYFRQFQSQQFIPKLIKKDYIFSDFVINFLKKSPQISQQIFQAIQVDVQQKLMGLLASEPANHPRVILKIQKSHYRDIVERSKHWAITEDKLSFSKLFTSWFCKQLRGEQIQNSTFDINLQELSYIEMISMQQRVKIAASIQSRLSNGDNQYIFNPLYELDSFIPAQIILQKSGLAQTTMKQTDFLQIEQSSVIFIQSINDEFYDAKKQLLNSTVIGYDSEFVPTQNKFQLSGVSIIQLATQDKCFIFDYVALRSQEIFISFFTELIESPKIIKIGHTFSSDFDYLNKNFPHKLSPKSILDIAKLFKDIFPNELYSSLTYMTNKFLGKKLCKYEQRSNWLRRPLKKTQLYYAALDAIVCIQIYNILSKSVHQKKHQPQFIKENEPLQLNPVQFDLKNFPEFQNEPIFLIDNMLKKLCTTLRNCGIDSQYLPIRDHDLALSQAMKQKRIIITRDTKLTVKKGGYKVPIYLLKEKSNTDTMFQQMVSVFKIDLSKYGTLSRCVKCNGSQIIIISKEQANKQLNFLHENTIQTFWRCTKCKQVYWEGGQFERAKSKFQALKKNE